MSLSVSKISLPREPRAPVPDAAAFKGDDFHRARYFSALIERYATRAEAETMIKFAREKRAPGMSFADTIQSVALFIHYADDQKKAIERMIANTKKTKEHVERDLLFAAACREAVIKYEGGPRTFPALRDALLTLYPGATKERILSALEAGNTPEGFSTATVIECMQLTEPPT